MSRRRPGFILRLRHNYQRASTVNGATMCSPAAASSTGPSNQLEETGTSACNPTVVAKEAKSDDLSSATDATAVAATGIYDYPTDDPIQPPEPATTSEGGGLDLPPSGDFSSTPKAEFFRTCSLPESTIAVDHELPRSTLSTLSLHKGELEEDQHVGTVSHISDRDTTTGNTPASPDSSNENQDYICPHCDRTFTSRIVLVGHLRIHRTETGEPVPEAPTYTHRTRLHCPHCPRTFTHRMGLFGHMRIHDSGLDRTPDTPTTSNTSTVHTPTLVPSVRDTTTTTTASSVADTDTADFSCPHCPRTFTSRIGLVGHLRIHRTETGEPVPGAPTYTHQAHLNCPHCPRTFRHRMGLFGHMRIHDDLR
nr:unnamed protein product [Spirometra erinaceieuropaei]